MSFWESLRVAFVALRANKLRSLLTMLGVIIGVGSVIIMISIVQGARQNVVQQFRGDGSDILFAVYAPKDDRRRGGRFEGLKMDDVRAVERRVGAVGGVSAQSETQVRVLLGRKDLGVKAVGVTPTYLDVNTETLGRGRFIEASDAQEWAKVCVLGDDIRKDLFGSEEALGRTIVLSSGDLRIPVTVVGLMERKGRSGFGDSPDKNLYLPLETLQKRFLGSERINSFTARALGDGQAETAADQVFAVLKQRHPERAQDFIVDTQEGLIKRLDSVLMIFQIILGGVGGLSLLVGGIGIMNIMLVSVTERTREIGIRKAVGAKRADILLQFITESMTVSGLGGLIGVGFGYGVSQVIGAVAGEQLKTYVPPWAAILGFGFAVGVGMFFGIYPAVRASKLDPIDALRYE